MGDLADRYLAGDPELQQFFSVPARGVFDDTPRPDTWAPGLAREMAQYQERIGGNGIIGSGQPVVVTGQQAGLFTGPLYTIYKAATAVRLAAEISQRTGVRCVPIYWVASEDHDFEEVRTTHFLGKRDRPFSLTYAPDGYLPGMPMYRVPVESLLHDLVDAAAARNRKSACGEEVRAFLHESLQQSVSLSEWHARLMRQLFRGTDLVIFEPQLLAARQGASRLMRQAILEPLLPARLVNEAGKRLAAMGITAQVVKDAAEVGFFLEMGDCRRKVVYRSGRFVLPEENLSFSRQDLLSLLEESPERFSPNATLRPLVQQALFPVTAYVAGPGELAYWAQLKELFAAFDLRMPAVFPRASGVISTLKLEMLLRRFNLAIEDLGATEGQLLETALRSVARHPAIPVLEMHRERLGAEFARLQGEMKELSLRDATPVLTGKYMQGVLRDLAWLERTARRSDALRVGAVRRQVARLQSSLMPSGQPQERVYNVFSFLFSEGWSLIPRILEVIKFEDGAPRKITLCS